MHIAASQEHLQQAWLATAYFGSAEGSRLQHGDDGDWLACGKAGLEGKDRQGDSHASCHWDD